MLAQSAILSGDYTNATSVHPLGLVLLAVCCVAIFSSRPQVGLAISVLFSWAVVPSQRIILLGVDFSFYRIVGVVLLVRLLLQPALRQMRWGAADWGVTGFAGVIVLATATRGGEVVNSIGQVGDFVVYYSVGRLCISTCEDWARFVKAMAVATVLVAIPLTIEKLTGRNLFSAFGGVPAITPVRDGKLRAQAAFVHPIIGGVIVASLVPVFLSLRSTASPAARWFLLAAACSGVYAVLLTASSTPLMALAAGLASYSLFSQRRLLGSFVFGLTMIGAVLHVISASGLHHLVFARFTPISGSTGYHRYLLWDAAITRFPEWALFGVNSTGHWGRGLNDVTCEYIAAGVRGGMAAVLCLVFVLVVTAQSTWCRSLGGPVGVRRIHWGMFSWLAANMMAFTAVTYFGQGISIFCVGLGALVSISRPGTASWVGPAV